MIALWVERTAAAFESRRSSHEPRRRRPCDVATAMLATARHSVSSGRSPRTAGCACSRAQSVERAAGLSHASRASLKRCRRAAAVDEGTKRLDVPCKSFWQLSGCAELVRVLMANATAVNDGSPIPFLPRSSSNSKIHQPLLLLLTLHGSACHMQAAEKCCQCVHASSAARAVTAVRCSKLPQETVSDKAPVCPCVCSQGPTGYLLSRT